jgi:hypothetical protein
MNLRDWVADVKASRGVENIYGRQCVALAADCWRRVLNLQDRPFVVGAADYWDSAKPEIHDWVLRHFDKIPNDPDTLPALGDAMLWARRKANGWFGHIAIVIDPEPTLKKVLVIEQNWVPQKLGERIDRYENALGFLRFRG